MSLKLHRSGSSTMQMPGMLSDNVPTLQIPRGSLTRILRAVGPRRSRVMPRRTPIYSDRGGNSIIRFLTRSRSGLCSLGKLSWLLTVHASATVDVVQPEKEPGLWAEVQCTELNGHHMARMRCFYRLQATAGRYGP
jgi:hypothetical protein